MFHSVGRIMGWAKNYRKRMILGFVCSFFATWCTAGPVMLAAWALGRMIGNAWGENELSGSLPWLCLSGIVVLILLRFFFTYWKNRLQESIGTERAAEQRMELGDVLKRVSLGYFAKNNLGDILAALTTELSTLELQSMKMVDAVVNGYIQVAVILLCVALFCPPAALVALIGVLVSAFALRGIGRQSARTAPVSHRAQETLSGAAVEYIHGLPVVKSFGQDGVSVQRFRDACRDNKAIVTGKLKWTNNGKEKSPTKYSLLSIMLVNIILERRKGNGEGKNVQRNTSLQANRIYNQEVCSSNRNRQKDSPKVLEYERRRIFKISGREP